MATFKAADKNGDKKISFNEYMEWLDRSLHLFDTVHVAAPTKTADGPTKTGASSSTKTAADPKKTDAFSPTKTGAAPPTKATLNELDDILADF